VPHATTDLLDVEHADGGPRDGPVLLLLHGWPDDRTSWDPVAAALHAGGIRTVAPTLRGYGATRFRSPGTPRTGDSARLALDAIALLDALGVERFSVAGHDWGSNAAEALAVGWPERVERLAMLATPPRLGGVAPAPFAQAQRQWYHWFMATRRGAEAVRADPIGFARVHWTNWSPPGWFDEATFERTAEAWRNPDFVDVTVHSYRARWGEAAPDPTGRWLEEKVKATPTLALPTLYVQGEVDGINPPSTSERVHAKFTGPFERVVLPGVGHFTQREAPGPVARLLAAHLGARR
jgi:pimeloyl-ACP methyl ester carboxylesterase